MKIVITGGGGFIGRKLAQALLADGLQRDGKPVGAIDKLVLVDAVAPAPLKGAPGQVECIEGDVSDAGLIGRIIGNDTDSVFHLAAMVSGAAEADFDLGMRVNLDGTRVLLEACRRLPKPARLVFTSSVAVFGGRLPPVLNDDTPLTAETSYGGQKAMGELLVADYTRKGFLDGRCAAPADHRGAAGQAEQGGVELRQRHPPRAALGPAGRLPGGAGDRGVDPVAAPGRREQDQPNQGTGT